MLGVRVRLQLLGDNIAGDGARLVRECVIKDGDTARMLGVRTAGGGRGGGIEIGNCSTGLEELNLPKISWKSPGNPKR